jgi:hypothetical protein
MTFTTNHAEGTPPLKTAQLELSHMESSQISLMYITGKGNTDSKATQAL